MKLPKYPFTTLLILSCLGASTIEAFNHNRLYNAYDMNELKSPRFTAIFEAMHEGIYPWSSTEEVFATNINESVTDNTELVSTKPGKTPSKKKKEAKHPKENTVSAAKDSKDSSEKNTESTISVTQASPSQTVEYAGKSKTKKTAESKFKKVDSSYFDDALFIGDSRTVGLSEYSDLKNATYYADVGMSVYSIFKKKSATVNGKEMTIDQALLKKSFKKIYICLGINEIGTGTDKTFAKKYGEVIDKIHELQPDAIIIIQSIMKVTKEKSKSSDVFNNTNITNRNKAIKKLANDDYIFYLNINKAITKDGGAIPKDYTNDGIHLKAIYYQLWADYLLDHGISLD